MNSEELELSLRTEFESHLKNAAAEMRQEFSHLQEQVEAEFSKHRSQLDTMFQEFSARFENERELGGGFTETVVEHLRLARDEGARITATAFTEAEEMQRQAIADAPPVVGINELSAAVTDIIAQDSQATILKSLVQHAGQFTPRGAFFIIKNEQFVGWRVFGKEVDTDDEAVREVLFPVSAPTVLGESVRSLSAVESSFGTYSDDAVYLKQLDFGQPERMYAIPLVARGRGVAVLYADYGTKGEVVNLDALETLVRVAGLTVEVLAAAPATRAVQNFQAVAADSPAPVSNRSLEDYADDSAVEAPSRFQTAPDERPAFVEQPEAPAEKTAEYTAQPIVVTEYGSIDDESEAIAVRDEDIVEDEAADYSYLNQPAAVEAAAAETYSPVVEEEEEVADSTAYQPVATSENQISDQTGYEFTESDNFAVMPSETVETPRFETPAFEPAANFEPAPSFAAEESYSNGRAAVPDAKAFEPAVAETAVAETAVAETAANVPVRSRFSDRHVDLPIEVGEDERRMHNDARRFARLLVSEIKLYNDQKVREGREAQDLYNRLREAIDRSRDMYDKRVQPPVAAKFDYFHYELVSSLAEGEERRLGGGYPGAAVAN